MVIHATKRHVKRSLQRAVLEALESRTLLSANVLTWHNDLARTGLNSNEQILTPSNVNTGSFGKLFSYTVTGQVYGQPLYVSNLNIPGKGTFNVVFIATMNNDVYAFNADSNSGAGQGLLWHVNLGRSAAVPNSFIGNRYGPDHDTTPLVGVTSTPVIDLASGTMYIDAFTNDIVGQDAYSHHIHALDLATGADKLTPMLVSASMAGNGVGGNGTTITFNPDRELQRAALTLVNGTLYVSYGAFADTDPYHGWILGFNAATLQLKSVFNTTPNVDTDSHSDEGGIWQSGAGLVSDGTNLFVETGNGDFNAAVGDYGDSFIKITPDNSTQASPNINGYGLSATDYFTPYNEQALADADADLGAGGALLLPTQPGAIPNELVGSGKQGFVYLVNADNMSHHSTTTDNVVQKVTLGHGVWGSPAYFNNSLYYHAVGDVMKRFTVSNGALSAAPAAQSSVVYNSQGGTPSISSNGNANGIAWDVQWDGTHQVLHAYDATTLTELYNSNQNAARDQMDAGVKFITPTIADGEVFVGTSDTLTVYGLLTPITTAPVAPSNLTATAINPSTINLAWTDNANNESAFKIERSTDNVNFTQIDTVSANTVAYSDINVSPNTQYYYRVRATNVIGDSAYSSPATATTPTSTGASDIYHFDAGTGTSVLDSTGGDNGTLTGATLPQWVAGKIGASALSFSGDGVYNSTANQSAVTLNTDLSPLLGSSSTLDVWIKTTQTGSNNHFQAPAITGVEQAGGNNDINWGTLDATGHIGLYVGGSGGVYSTAPVNDGQWHNVAMTRDATTGLVRIYIDGLLNASAVLDTGNKTSSFSTFGALTDVAADGVTRTGANYFNGQLDEIRLYNQALGASEVAGMALIPQAPVLQSATAESGPVVHLAFTNTSPFVQTLEVDRKVGVDGAWTAIKTLAAGVTSYDDSDVQTGTAYYYRITAADLTGTSAASNILSVMPPAPTVVGRTIFYNSSKFDGQNGSSNLTDDNAIATDKQALLPGETASFQNYTSYSKGINGIMIDVANLVVLPRLDDFIFRVGNDNNPSGWTTAPTPELINSYPGRGPGGSTQITVIWNDNIIQNEWLQVTLVAQPHLGLLADDVFYFGNAIGDTGNSSSDAQVTPADATLTANNETASAGLTNPYDFNRDGIVDATDINIANTHQTSGSGALQLIALAGAGDVPTVVTAANASPGTVAGTTTSLSVLGDDSGGETNLTYTWAAVGTPAASVLFSANGTNAAKNTTATFAAAGTYTLQVTITNAALLSVTSMVSVQVNQTAGSVVVTPAAAAIAANNSDQFTASELDQFGNPMATQPAFTWSVTGGSGSINTTGLYTAPRTSGTGTVTATANSLTASSAITVYYDALAWYKADAASGTTLADSSAFNQTATLTGAAAFGPGVSGNALNLTGGTANLPAGIVSSLNDFTIAAWVKPTTLANWARIFDFGTGTGNYMFLTSDAGTTNALRFAILPTGGGGEQEINGPAIAVNVWTHVAVTLAGNVGTLYVNGVAVATNAAMTFHPTNLGYTTQNYLGKSQFAADPAYNGSIDDFRIYSRALSAQQVLQLAAPTVINPAAGPASPVTTTSTALSVLGADVTAGESALIYTWSAITPPAPVTFSVNGTNASKNTTATFAAAGTYNFQVTITNPLTSVSTVSTVTVAVAQTPTGFAVSPAGGTILPGSTLQFLAGAADQFGNAISGQPSTTWTIVSGGGTINSAGVYTAGANPGSVTIRGTTPDSHTGTATITVAAAVAFYKADASSGTTLIDSSGNNKTGALTGAAAFTAGVSGNALSLTGGNATLPTGIVSGLNDFTIAAWINPSSLVNWARVFDFGTGTNAYMFLSPDAGATNKLRFAITTSGNTHEQVVDGPAITPGVWTHVAITLAGNTATLYVNGIAVGTNTAMTLHPAALGNTNQNYLGKSQFADPPFNGSIDDFRIYGLALSAAEVLQLATPTVVTAATAPAALVTTAGTQLSVLGNDVTAGESGLTYTWSTTGTPPAAVAFSANGTNASKNTTATFTAAGTYNFLVTITNPGGLSITSAVSVVVNLALTSIAFVPAPAYLYAGASEQLAATGLDQFGAALAAQPTFTYSLTSGTGTLTSAGNYTAPLTATTATIQVASGAVNASAEINTVAALLGDANLDTHVDAADLNTVLHNLGTSNSNWTAGNFDGAPTIDLNDLDAVLNNLGNSATIPTVVLAQSSASVVPIAITASAPAPAPAPAAPPPPPPTPAPVVKTPPAPTKPASPTPVLKTASPAKSAPAPVPLPLNAHLEVTQPDPSPIRSVSIKLFILCAPVSIATRTD